MARTFMASSRRDDAMGGAHASGCRDCDSGSVLGMSAARTGRGAKKERRRISMLKRMDNVGIVVDDLKAVTAFFVELGLELEGETTVEGPWVDGCVGLKGVRCDIAMLRTPAGHGRLELAKYQRPAAIRAEPADAPANTLGIRRI